MPGRLLVIGTPIGNLQDLSPRALEAMRSCSLLLCEDTRHSGRLVAHFGLSVRLESFHDWNEDAKAARIIDRVLAGETVGMISDAGMPVVSDPGFALVRLARERGVPVEPIPGPFAGVLALVASGLAPLPFAFYGFAPHREGERREFYRQIAAKQMTAIVYESAERVVASLTDAAAMLGDVEATVAREMTKMHEEFLNGTLSALAGELAARDSIRGEITLVIAPSVREEAGVDAATLRREFERLREEGLRRNDASKALAEKYGLSKNEVYRILLGDAAD